MLLKFSVFASVAILGVKAKNPCVVCGEGKSVTKPNVIWQLPGQPAVQCGLLETVGAQGLIPDSFCGTLPALIGKDCGCVGESDQEPATNTPVSDAPVVAPTDAPVVAPTLAPAVILTTDAPVVPATDVPVAHALLGSCSTADLDIFFDGGGTTKEQLDFCRREYGENACFLDSTCIVECMQLEYGYTPDCADCFIDVYPCMIRSGCLLPCAVDSYSNECIECAAKKCDPEQYRCTGFPYNATIGGDGDEGGNESCSVCGDGKSVTAPDEIFTFPGQPAAACGILEISGEVGLIPSMECAQLPEIIADICKCEEISADGGDGGEDEDGEDGDVDYAYTSKKSKSKKEGYGDGYAAKKESKKEGYDDGYAAKKEGKKEGYGSKKEAVGDGYAAKKGDYGSKKEAVGDGYAAKKEGYGSKKEAVGDGYATKKEGYGSKKEAIGDGYAAKKEGSAKKEGYGSKKEAVGDGYAAKKEGSAKKEGYGSKKEAFGDGYAAKKEAKKEGYGSKKEAVGDGYAAKKEGSGDGYTYAPKKEGSAKKEGYGSKKAGYEGTVRN